MDSHDEWDALNVKIEKRFNSLMDKADGDRRFLLEELEKAKTNSIMDHVNRLANRMIRIENMLTKMCEPNQSEIAESEEIE